MREVNEAVDADILVSGLDTVQEDIGTMQRLVRYVVSHIVCCLIQSRDPVDQLTAVSFPCISLVASVFSS